MQRSNYVSQLVTHLNHLRDEVRVKEGIDTRSDMGKRILIEACWSYFNADEKQRVVQEIIKCREDFRYLAGNYIWLFQPRSGRPGTLDLNDSQEYILGTIEHQWSKGKPGRILQHKARQVGASTMALGLAVWQSAFFTNRVAMMIAQDPYHSAYIFRAFQYNLFNLPYWMQPNVLAKEEKESMILGVQDESGYGGLNNYILSFQANKMSAFAQGKAINFFWCLTANTQVIVENRRPVSISSLKAGDKVSSPSGKLVTIKKVFSAQAKDICGGKGIRVTTYMNSDFPIEGSATHLIRAVKCFAGDGMKKWKRRSLGNEGMMHLGEITRRHAVAYPVKPITNDGEIPPSPPLPKTVCANRRAVPIFPEPTYEWGFAVGLYLAEGHVPESCGQLVISLDSDEQDLADRFASGVNFPYSPNVTGGINGSKTRCYHFYNSTLARWFCWNFGRTKGKRIPDLCWDLGRDFLAGLVEALILGDGYIDQSENYAHFVTIRSSLACGIRDAVLSLGHGMGGILFTPSPKRYGKINQARWDVKFGGSVYESMAAEYGWPRPDQQKRKWKSLWQWSSDKKEVWCNVRKVEHVDIDVVYDLEVDSEDHLYQLASGISHNSTELSNWPEDKARRIIKGDINAALVERPGCIALLESKPEGAAGFWYDLWHDYEKEGMRSSWFSSFIPCFFERTRVTVVPKNFKPNQEEVEMRERYQLEWKKCSNPDCGSTYYSGGSGSAYCLRCGGVEGEGVVLSNEQLGWYRTKRSEVKSKEDLKLFKQEFAITAEEGFQVHGHQVFPDDVIQYCELKAINPRWVGEVRNDFSFHNRDPLPCPTHKGEKHCLECHQDHSEDEMSLNIWEFPPSAPSYYGPRGNVNDLYHIGCLPDGEEVITKEGPKNIEAVTKDDLLLDKDGHYVAIKQIMRREYSGEMIEIGTIGSPFPVRLTPEHPVLLVDAKRSNETWVKAEDVKEKDIVACPALTDFEITGKELSKYWPDCSARRPDFVQGFLPMFDSRFWWMVGLYLADGWTRKDGKAFDVTVSLNAKTEQHVADRFAMVAQEVLNRKCNRRKMKGAIIIKFSSPEIVEFFRQFGGTAHTKFVPWWLLGLPREYRLALVKGYWEGDGCDSIGSGPKRSNCMAFTSVSFPLLRGMQRILLSLGYFGSVKRLRGEGFSSFSGKVSRHSVCYEMKIGAARSARLSREWQVEQSKPNSGISRGMKTWVEGRKAFVKVRTVERTGYTGFVNNFETETHSYCSRLMTVHNCDAAYGLDEGDYGCISVLKQGKGMTEPDVQVAEFRGRVDAGELGTIAYILGQLYNYARMAIEVMNGPGEKTQLSVIQKGYDNLWVWKHYDSTKQYTNRFGWVTNSRTKPMLITNFIQWTRQRIVEMRSKEFLGELKTFVRQVDYDESGGAARGKHDDAVMAGLINLFCFHDEHWNQEQGRIVIPERNTGLLTAETPADTQSKFWVTCLNGHEMGTDNPQGWICPECKKMEPEHKVYAKSAFKARIASAQRRIAIDYNPNDLTIMTPGGGGEQMEIL